MRFTYNNIHVDLKTVNAKVGSVRPFSYNRMQMTKDAPLAFRIEADLKKKLLKLANAEARSLSQLCELLLRIGVDQYEKEGHKYLRKMLSRAGEDLD